MEDQHIGAFYKKLNDDLRQAAIQFQKDLVPIKQFEKENAILLSQYGWYISSWMMMDEVWRMLAAVRDGRMVEVEQKMMQYYRDNLSELCTWLSKKYPDRSVILRQAFEAHEKNMYYASTILFISQADGLGDGKLMRKSMMKGFLESRASTDLTNAVLGTVTAINADSKDKSNYFSDLNRHEVMHGLYSSYGQEVNSLKALSLLTFVAQFVGRRGELLKFLFP
jgi:hypothetical protein